MDCCVSKNVYTIMDRVYIYIKMLEKREEIEQRISIPRSSRRSLSAALEEKQATLPANNEAREKRRGE